MSNEKNIFEVAARRKMRFPFKGLISTEDLWDLSVRDLDSIFKSLNAQLKQTKEEESLLDTKTKQDEELDTKIEIIKYIVKVKQAEETGKLEAKEKRDMKQKLLKLKEAKEDEVLANKSPEEIQKMIDELKD